MSSTCLGCKLDCLCYIVGDFDHRILCWPFFLHVMVAYLIPLFLFSLAVCGSRYGMGTLGHSWASLEPQDWHSYRLPCADARKMDWPTTMHCRGGHLLKKKTSSHLKWKFDPSPNPTLTLGVYGALVDMNPCQRYTFVDRAFVQNHQRIILMLL